MATDSPGPGGAGGGGAADRLAEDHIAPLRDVYDYSPKAGARGSEPSSAPPTTPLAWPGSS
jgi:hypothetical protein